MSTDRELLELAAKAAGIEVTAVVADGIPHRFGGGYWNPLTNDGDALRLAVKLGISVIQWSVDVSATHGPTGREWPEPWGSDPYAATRRAIVRAAAEIGRQVNEGTAA
ncbi:hypothetical protein [Malikia sp.]|uniref:hypothetical protein n=1 Tax=Malikia sp. TaxID=2070706 RepID=UPI002617D987|nr:hypothetical protein [Malikia sp.]MDD2730388.1 hypothetical protein [Malikia sp.]